MFLLLLFSFVHFRLLSCEESSNFLRERCCTNWIGTTCACLVNKYLKNHFNYSKTLTLRTSNLCLYFDTLRNWPETHLICSTLCGHLGRHSHPFLRRLMLYKRMNRKIAQRTCKAMNKAFRINFGIKSYVNTQRCNSTGKKEDWKTIFCLVLEAFVYLMHQYY